MKLRPPCRPPGLLPLKVLERPRALLPLLSTPDGDAERDTQTAVEAVALIDAFEPPPPRRDGESAVEAAARHHAELLAEMLKPPPKKKKRRRRSRRPVSASPPPPRPYSPPPPSPPPPVKLTTAQRPKYPSPSWLINAVEQGLI